MVREPELCRPLRRRLSYRERCRRVRRTAQESAAQAIRGRRAFSIRLCRVRYRPPSFGEVICCTSVVAQPAAAPMQALYEAQLAAGIGVEGDRYATRLGTYSKNHHVDR